MQFQKISILSPQKGLKFPGEEGGGGVGGSVRPKNLKKCMKFNRNFQRGGGLRKKSLPWGGIDIFWNYTVLKYCLILILLQIRWYAYRRPNEQPGLIGRFIENIKEGFERNKEMQVCFWK